MGKIKILRIIARLNMGGPAVHTVLLTNEMNDDQFESILMTGSVSNGEGDMGYLAERSSVKPVYIPCLGRAINPFRDIRAFFQMLAYMRRYRPHIVHTHTAKAGALGRLAASISGVPVKIHTFHGHIFAGYFNEITSKFFIFIEKLLAGLTDGIVVVSAMQKEEIAEKYKIADPAKCHVIRLGFDLDQFLTSETRKGKLRKSYNFKDEDILVGIVGRLTAIKNHRLFIDMAEYVAGHAPRDIAERIKFVVVGDGELKNTIVEYSKQKGLEDKVYFTGWVTDMAEAYADLDIVTLTSINEGTPVSLIEAMACMKPVVATSVGAVSDTVGECGMLVEGGDYESMGRKVLELCASPETRERLGKIGRDCVRKIYSKERLVFELKKLYKDLLSKNMKGSS